MRGTTRGQRRAATTARTTVTGITASSAHTTMPPRITAQSLAIGICTNVTIARRSKAATTLRIRTAIAATIATTIAIGIATATRTAIKTDLVAGGVTGTFTASTAARTNCDRRP